MIRTKANYQKQMRKRIGRDFKMTRVLTGGAYDLLHSGHILALQRMKKLGDYLIVNVNPDARIKEKKGDSRPILSEKERMYVMLELKCVDEVCCIHSKPNKEGWEYVCKVLGEVLPDIYASSTNDKKVKDYCKSMGIKLIHIPDIPGFDNVHSEGIIRKIKKIQLDKSRRNK